MIFFLADCTDTGQPNGWYLFVNARYMYDTCTRCVLHVHVDSAVLPKFMIHDVISA